MFKQRLCQIKIRNQKKLCFLLFDKELSLITLNADFKHPKWEKFSSSVYDYKNYAGFLNIKDFIESIIDTIKHLLNLNITNSDIDFIFIRGKKEIENINIENDDILIRYVKKSTFDGISYAYDFYIIGSIDNAKKIINYILKEISIPIKIKN